MKNLYKYRLLLTSIIGVLSVCAVLGYFYPIKLFDLQLSSLIQRNLIDFSFISLGLILFILIITMLFGRVYCSVICPFGILQECICKINKNKSQPKKNQPFKYFIMVISFGLLISGSAIAIRYIDPYTLFNSIFTLTAIGWVALVVIIGLVLFKKRYFCTNLCPVGSLLGLFSKFSLCKINIDKADCVKCKICERNCPSECINIDNNYNIDNETCIKCYKCFDVCPKQAIKYNKKAKQEKTKFNIKRRQIIISTMVFAVFAGAIKTGLIIKDKVAEKIKFMIFPPGLKDNKDALNHCFNCNLCVNNCPTKIIKKSDNSINAVHLDYSDNFCKYDCNICNQVCPNGTIKRLTLEEKQNTQIAWANVDKDKCINCKTCINACPKQAIYTDTDNKSFVDLLKCIGCGQCKHACPEAAINLYAIKGQKKL